MGTAREDLLALLQEATLSIRKHFGMYGQIRIEIRDVTPERITVTIRTRKPLEGARLAENVRNAVLNWLQDMLPVERFVAVYDNPELGISGEIHDLPYARELPKAGAPGSSEILIEQHAGSAREELWPRFRQAWAELLQEGNEMADVDAGLRTVEDIFSNLGIDEEWSTRERRGFTWWAHRHAQRVWAEERVADAGVSLSLVHVETDRAERALGALAHRRPRDRGRPRGGSRDREPRRHHGRRGQGPLPLDGPGPR